MASLNLVNIFARDHVGLAKFYHDVFGFPEIKDYRSPIFRCLDAGKSALGINAWEAYALLNLRPPRGNGIRTFINIEARSKAEVDARVNKALRRGARMVKEPHITYYNFYQAVLTDPEGNVFRINRVLPKPRKK